MNSVDIAIIIALGVSALAGIYWGLIRQVLALMGLVVGVLAARRFGPTAGDWLTSFVVSDSLARALGFVLVLMAVSTLSSLIASALRLYVGLLFLGRLDHVLGGVLGLIFAIIACVVLVAVGATLGDSEISQAVRQSWIAAALTRNFGGALWLLDQPMQSAAREAFGPPPLP